MNRTYLFATQVVLSTRGRATRHIRRVSLNKHITSSGFISRAKTYMKQRYTLPRNVSNEVKLVFLRSIRKLTGLTLTLQDCTSGVMEMDSLDEMCICDNCGLDRLASPTSTDMGMRFRHAIRRLAHYEASVQAMAAAAAAARARTARAEAEAQAEAAEEQTTADAAFARRRALWGLLGMDLQR